MPRTRSTLADAACLVAASNADYYTDHRLSGAKYWTQQFFCGVHCYPQAGLVCLATVLALVYLLWLVLTVRYHCQVTR